MKMTDKDFLKNLFLLFGVYAVGSLIWGAVIGIPILLLFKIVS